MKTRYMHIGDIETYSDDGFFQEHRGKLRALLIPLGFGTLYVSYLLLLSLGWIEF